MSLPNSKVRPAVALGFVLGKPTLPLVSHSLLADQLAQLFQQVSVDGVSSEPEHHLRSYVDSYAN